MKNLIAYKTGIEHTDCIVEAFSNSINKLFTMNFNGQIPITIRRAGRDSPMGVK